MTQRTPTEIAAELAQVRAARTALATGQRVTDVWKDGRRMTFSAMSMTDFDTLIASLERELDAATSVARGGRRRRAIALGWKN